MLCLGQAGLVSRVHSPARSSDGDDKHPQPERHIDEDCRIRPSRPVGATAQPPVGGQWAGGGRQRKREE